MGWNEFRSGSGVIVTLTRKKRNRVSLCHVEELLGRGEAKRKKIRQKKDLQQFCCHLSQKGILKKYCFGSVKPSVFRCFIKKQVIIFQSRVR